MVLGSSPHGCLVVPNYNKQSAMNNDRYSAERQSMVDAQLRARGITDERVLAAMTRVPRHEFVTEPFRREAYEDHPLPIGENQTVSQPYIVAIMLQALRLNGFERVLEIGTGSGYQTGLLAELAREVFSVERYASLATSADEVIRRLNYDKVSIRIGDGTQGWPEKAPFDAITVTAAAPRVPPALFAQLREGGRMIVPVGPAYAQELMLIRKENAGPVITKMEGCRFVPLIGEQGYSEPN